MRAMHKANAVEQRRRLRLELMRKLPDGPILLTGGVEQLRNGDVHYVFRQKSNFLYLTGVPEPGYRLLLDPRKKRSVLFVPEVDSHYRVWLGHVPSPTEAGQRWGFDETRPCGRFAAEAKAARRSARRCYADADSWKEVKAFLGAENRPSELIDALDEMRACKTPGELALMRRANEVSGKAHLAVMRAAKEGMFEYQLQAEFERHCLSEGLKHLGYPSIVAAGRNASVLHYHHNDARLRRQDLLLIDAGAECEGYSADITRTFPIGGRFSQRQRDVYAIVLETQKDCIRRAHAGVLSGELHLHSMRMIAEGLRALKILRGPVDDLVLGGAIRLFYPHGLTHMLGLDVHDSLGGKRRAVPAPAHVRLRFNARLEPGFVITMEPGIYFIEALLKDPALREKYKDQINFAKADSFLDFGGVRIEDDVLIAPSGPPENLTSVPKEIAEIEALVRR